MEDLSLKISKVIKQTRKEKNMSITQVLENCHVSRSYINMIESGRNPKTDKPIVPSLDTVEELCNGLGISKIKFLTDIGYLDDQKDAPLLNYSQTIEELINYRLSMEGIEMSSLSFDQRQKMIASINEYIEFLIFKVSKENPML